MLTHVQRNIAQGRGQPLMYLYYTDFSTLTSCSICQISPSRQHCRKTSHNLMWLTVIASDGTVLKNPFQNIERRHIWLWNHIGNSQVLYDMTYTKQHSYTALRLTASGDHRTFSRPGHATYDFGCSRWYTSLES